jgi:hypothetical protein
MPEGGGKYEEACARAREETGAAAVLLVVIGGKLGSGFSVATLTPELLASFPRLLRDVADGIERDSRDSRDRGFPS